MWLGHVYSRAKTMKNVYSMCIQERKKKKLNNYSIT